MFARHGTIQEKINTFYESNPVQCFIAILIFANFILNAAQSELNPDDGDLYRQDRQDRQGKNTRPEIPTYLPGRRATPGAAPAAFRAKKMQAESMVLQTKTSRKLI